MRFLVWTCRVIITVVIGCFVATVFYLTHDVTMDDAAKAALNWITIVGTAVVGIAWPLMRKYWQALLLLVGVGVVRALFGTDPGLSSLDTPLLTPFQSDFLWVPIGATFLTLVGSIIVRAIISDRRMRAMKQQAPTVVTGQAVADQTTAALQEKPVAAEDSQPAATEAEADTSEASPTVEKAPAEEAPSEEAPAATEEPAKSKKAPKKK